jgi:hypothetical protein
MIGLQAELTAFITEYHVCWKKITGKQSLLIQTPMCVKYVLSLNGRIPPAYTNRQLQNLSFQSKFLKLKAIVLDTIMLDTLPNLKEIYLRLLTLYA